MATTFTRECLDGEQSRFSLVPLGDDRIQAVPKDGHVWAAVKGMCESLSLDYSAQLKRLKASRWGVMAVIATTAADGKSYQTTTLRADKIPMWLVTVERSRIKDTTVRAKIDRFQDEAADVLARHFAPALANSSPSIPADKLHSLVSTIVQEAMAPIIAQIGTGPRLPGPFWTVAAWLEENMPEWDTTRKQRHQIGQEAKRLVTRACPKEQVGYYNRDLAFLAHQEVYLARAAQRAYRRALREGQMRTAPHLFSEAA